MADEINELDEATSEVETKDEGSEKVDVHFSVPKDADPQLVEKAMKQVATITKSQLDAKNSLDEKRKEYEREGKRRFKFIIQSNVPNDIEFELTYPSPDSKDRPIKVQGICGDHIHEEGLPMYALKALQGAYFMGTEPIPNVNPGSDQALQYRSVKRPKYNIQILEEVKNPVAPGKAGK